MVFTLAVTLSACKAYQKTQTNTQEAANNSPAPADNQEASATISVTDEGFEPSTVTVKSGDSILWVNNSLSTVQIASDDHPTHKLNPEITGNQFVAELAAGASKTVVVKKAGTWGYHDHLKPTMKGKITVE